MNRKGDGGDNIAWDYVAFLIIGVVFFGGMYYWVSAHVGSVALWEDLYAKEIARVLNEAQPGDELFLDVTPATKIAFDNGMRSDEIFRFDNDRHTVSVHLKPHSGTTFSYFNAVRVREDYRLELLSSGSTTNRLHFFVEARNEP